MENKKVTEEERDLRTYCPKCDMMAFPCGRAAKEAEKHERTYCIFCHSVNELWEFFEDERKPIKIETHIGRL